MFMEMWGDLKSDEVLLQKSEGEIENRIIKRDSITRENTGKRWKEEQGLKNLKETETFKGAMKTLNNDGEDHLTNFRQLKVNV